MNNMRFAGVRQPAVVGYSSSRYLSWQLLQAPAVFLNYSFLFASSPPLATSASVAAIANANVMSCMVFSDQAWALSLAPR
jgi:hypothetical protein